MDGIVVSPVPAGSRAQQGLVVCSMGMWMAVSAVSAATAGGSGSLREGRVGAAAGVVGGSSRGDDGSGLGQPTIVEASEFSEVDEVDEVEARWKVVPRLFDFPAAIRAAVSSRRTRPVVGTVR